MLTLYATPPGKLPAWKITQRPGDPRLVVFRKWDRSGRLMLHKIAKWSGRRWHRQFWQPETPGVPIGILREVTAAMVQWELQREVK